MHMAVDYNKFSRITVNGSTFTEAMSVSFDFRHSNLSFSLVLESGGGCSRIFI